MSQISTAKAILDSSENPFGDDDQQLQRQMATDSLVHATRANTPQSVLDKRAVPRMSIAEINAMDADALRERFAKIRRDDRHPAEQVMDMVDLPRNTIANIAVGRPTASGVAQTIGIPTIIGGALGFLAGGPAGAAVGAGTAAGIFGGASAAAGLVRAAGSSEGRQKVIDETGGAMGAAGQPEIHASDALRAMGVKNRVVNGILGFAGDVAFDPLTYVGAPGWGATLKQGEKAVHLTGPASRGIKRAIAGAAAGTPVDSVWGRWLATHPDLAKGATETAEDAADRISRAVYGEEKGGLLHKSFKMLGANAESKGGRLLNDFYAPVANDAAAVTRTQAAREAIQSGLPGSGRTLRIGVPKDDVGAEVLHLPFSGLAGQPISVMVPGGSAGVKTSRMARNLSAIKDLDPATGLMRSNLNARPYINAMEIAKNEAEMAAALNRASEDEALYAHLKNHLDSTETAFPGEQQTVPAPSPRADEAIPAELTGRDVPVQVSPRTTEMQPEFDLDGNPTGREIPVTTDPGRHVMRPEWEHPSEVPTPNAPQGALRLTSETTPDVQRTLYDPYPASNPEGTTTPPGAPAAGVIDNTGRMAQRINESRQAAQEKFDDLARVNESLYQDAIDDIDLPSSVENTGIENAQDLLSQMEAVNIARDGARLARVRAQNWKTLGSMVGKTRTMSPERAIEMFGNEGAKLLASNASTEHFDMLAAAANQTADALTRYADKLRQPIEAVASGDEKFLVMWANRILNTDDAMVGASMFSRVADGLREAGMNSNGATIKSLDFLDKYNRRFFGIRSGLKTRELADIAATGAESETHGQLEQLMFYKQIKGVARDLGIESNPKSLQDLATYVGLKQYEQIDPTGKLYRFYEFDKNMPAPVGDQTVPNFGTSKPTPSALRVQMDEMLTTGPLSRPEVRAKLDAIASDLNAKYAAGAEVARRERILNIPTEGYTGPNILTDEFAKKVKRQSRVFDENPTLGPFSARTSNQVVFYDHEDKVWRKFYDFDRDLVERFPDAVKAERDLSKLSASEIAQLGDEAKRAEAPTVYGLGGESQEVPWVPPPPPTSPADLIRDFYAKQPQTAEQLVEARDNVARYEALAKADPEFRQKWRSGPTDVVELNKLANEGRFVALTGGARPDTGQMAFVIDPGAAMHAYIATHQRMLAKRRILKNIGDNARFVHDTENLHLIAGQPGRDVRLSGGGIARVEGAVKSSGGDLVPAVTIGGKQYRGLSKDLTSGNASLLLDLEGRDLEKALVESRFAEKLEDVARVLSSEKTPELLAGLDKLTGYWKTLTLAHPSWTLFDIIGNTVNSLSGGALPQHLFDPKMVSENFRVAKYGLRDADAVKDLTLNIGGRKYTAAEFAQLAADHHIMGNNIAIETMGQFLQKDPSLAKASDRVWRRLWAPWFRLNQFSNDVTRLGAFRSFMEQGHTAESAAQKTLQSMFDFADYTHVEREYFRRIIPFYSFMRANLGYQMHLLMQNPAYANMAPKLRQALEETVAGDDAIPQNQRPGWMRDNLAAQIATGDQGFSLMLAQGVIPQAEIYNALLPLVGIDGVQKFMHYIVSGMNPVISAPIQIGAGQEFFSGRKIAPAPFGDVTPVEFARNQVRLVSEPGKVGDAFGRSPAQGVGRALIGGRLQAMDQARISSTKEREFRDEETALRSAIRRSDRNSDENARVDAEAQLLRLYEQMDSAGFPVPKWAKRQLAEVSAP